MKYRSHEEVTFNRLKLTNSLYLEDVAILDYGYHLDPSGELPEGHYCRYIRVSYDSHNYGIQSITDYSMCGYSLPSLEDFAVFKDSWNKDPDKKGKE